LEQTTEALTIRRVALEDLYADPANARAHPPENLSAIEASLRRFGQAEPLVVQAGTGRVIGGNGRLAAMRSLGWSESDVVEVDVDDVTATALGIALNRSGDLAAWDEPALAKVLEALRDADALDGVGYSPSDIATLLAAVQGEPQNTVEDHGPPEPPENPVSRIGDLWLLGDHRLLCGDSTDLACVQRVMEGERAALCATDPPYLVDYTGERPNDSGKDWTRDYREVDIKDAEGFFRATFMNVLAVLAEHAAIYCWHAHKRSGLIQKVWDEVGILDHQQVIWVKPSPVFGRVYWHFRHEPCAMGWRRGSKPEHDGNHEFDSVWECDYDGLGRRASDHPTAKPVELFVRPIRKHTKPEAVVFEPFSGSGSQIVAAERTGRRCRAIELSPAFVDVGVSRWEQATGKTATLEATGQTFAEVAVERAAEPVGEEADG
jgi:DNA modification methylase